MNINMAACETSSIMRFSSHGGTADRLLPVNDTSPPDGHAVLEVPCEPVGDVLESLGMRHLDFASVDVEGAELPVLRSLVRSGISIGVAMIEVREDGNRRPEMELLLGAGMSYVGQLNSRNTIANEIINDAYVNFTHMELRFPRAQLNRARRTLPP
mmetsp:Transcript_472/g.1526  ORF Transcript_472/g.1526 Transcript_472/m.1526 type:complete len:156 (+) Transcript_472:781-1248(+)